MRSLILYALVCVLIILLGCKDDENLPQHRNLQALLML